MRLKERFETLRRALRAWDAKLVEGEPKLLVPKSLPSTDYLEGDALEAMKRLVEGSERFWNEVSFEEVDIPIGYDGRRIVYRPEAELDETEELKLLIASLFEHYLYHKSDWRLAKEAHKPYTYVLIKVYGRYKALEAMRLSAKVNDVYDRAALRAMLPRRGAGFLETVLFPSQKVKLFIGDAFEMDESLEKLVLERPELEKKMFAYALLAEAPKLLANGETQ